MIINPAEKECLVRDNLNCPNFQKRKIKKKAKLFASPNMEREELFLWEIFGDEAIFNVIFVKYK